MRSLELKNLQRALLSFSRGAARRGREYFLTGRVVSGERLDNDSFRFLVKGSRPEGYTVEITLGEHRWESSCSCPMEFDCKHVYASLLFLEKHGDSQGAVPSLKEQLENRSGFFSLVPKRRDLSETQLDFIKRLEKLYQTHQRRDMVDSFKLHDLFPSWNTPSPWLQVRIAPDRELTRLQFWHFLVSALAERQISIPNIFGESNDVTPSLALIQEWRDQLLCEEWEQAYRQHPSVVPDRGQSDYRWVFDNNCLCLEVKHWNETSFRKIRADEIQWLRYNYRSVTSAICPDATPLLTEHLQFEYSFSQKISITLAVATRLNALLHIREIQARVVFPGECPLEICDDPISWRMDQSPDKPGWYRFQLWQQTAPAEGPIKILPGANCLYLRESVLFKGPPPPFPIRHVDIPPVMEIPKMVVESPFALPSVLAACRELDAALEQQIRRVTLAPMIRAETRFIPGTQKPAIYFSPQLIDPQNGQPLSHLRDLGWEPLRSNIVKSDKEIIVYSFPDLTPIQSALAKLPSTFDRSLGLWRVKHPKSSLQTFAEWSQQLPSEFALQVSSDLSGLCEPPAEVSITLELADSGGDWFDLRLALPRSEIEFTREELQLLLQARGQAVRLESRAQRQVHLNTADKLFEKLDEIGLTLEDLADDGERLHIIHLRNLLDAGLLPDKFRSELESRLAKIQTQVRPEVPPDIQAALRSYQIGGFHFLAYLSENRFGGILADDMGLGKTLQALAWLAWLETKRAPEDTTPSLIVCPKSVVDNWVSESGRFYPSLEIRAQFGTRFDVTNIPARSALVINYTQLRRLQDELLRIHWHAIILDEGQYLKNPSSQTAHSASSLKAHHKILLTGTPIENRLLDLWSLLRSVMPGVLGSQSSFVRRFQDKADPTSGQRLARRVRPFLLRRTKEEVAPELPPRIEEDIRCQMEGVQEKLYRAELKLARQHLLKLKNDEQLARERFNVLTSLLRLRQICCHPALVDPETRHSSSAKLDALVELLDPLIAEGNKILVFSQFVEMLKLVQARLKELETPTYFLTGETKGRAKVIEEFGNEPGAAIFLLSLKAGGAGLNLASASYVLLLDPWWNPAVENQAIDRTHRIGQTKTVFAYRLIIQGSIEDKIRQLQLYKAKLAGDVLGEESFAQALTLDDFRYLLS
jgi:SNF2-related domain/Helicase conserved C-terminal domain